MDIKKQNEAMAEIEGYKTHSNNDKLKEHKPEFKTYGVAFFTKNGRTYCWGGKPADEEPMGVFDGFMPSMPNYTDLNVLHRIVRGMDAPTITRYITELHGVCETYQKLFRPDIPQIREAILRAFGKWEEE